MAKIDMLKDVAERLAEYKMFYPDATTTTVSVADAKSISYEKGFELSKKICRMTHSGLLEFSIFGNNMFVFKSKEFLKVADGFKKGAKVRFYDPRTPDVSHESVMMADGMRYNCGLPFIWTEDSELDDLKNSDTFAIYWRPIEEMSEK
jgi:hypothetical protein